MHLEGLKKEKPRFVLAELDHEHRKAIRIGKELRFRYRVCRPRFMACGEGRVLKSTASGLLYDGQGLVGFIAMNRYDLRHCYDDEEFVNVMDAEDEHQYQLAWAIANKWNATEDVACYGSIVEIEGAWIDRRCADKKLLRLCVPRISTAVFPDLSLLVFKACPLQDLSQVKKETKTKALMRMYGGLGARLFPGESGLMGWMWVPHPDVEDILDRPGPGRLIEGQHFCMAEVVDCPEVPSLPSNPESVARAQERHQLGERRDE